MIIMSQTDQRLQETIDNAFALFDDKVEKERFSALINSLGDLKWNFLRACRLYGQAVKCEKCNADVAMTMLCSTIESIKGKGSRPFAKFRKFLIENCPQEARTSSMRIFVSKDEVRQATFEESISYIYGNFRSLFLHEGIARVEAESPPGLERTRLISSSLADKHRQKEKIYMIELLKVLNWFENVVKESLWYFLTRTN